MRVRSDNRWDNLKDISQGQNNSKKGLGSTNTSGIVGVYYDRTHEVWKASLRIEGKRFHMGTFKEKDDAVKALEEFRQKVGVHSRKPHISKDLVDRTITGLSFNS